MVSGESGDERSTRASELQGIRVQEELQQLLSELPAIFQHTVSLLPSLTPAISYYQVFITFSTGR